jgi:hypothetical protein
MRVLTPGFDEANYDDVATVELVTVRFHDDEPQAHWGRHREDPNGETAVMINF